MKRYLALLMIIFSCMLAAACAPNLSSNTYSGGQVGVASKAISGTIVSKRTVQIDNNSHVGGLIGTASGAVAGSTIGSGTTANVLGGIGGAVVGGLVGNAIDKGIHSQQGFEYIIRTNKGETIAVTQAMDTNLPVGSRVLVIYGEKTRVIPDSSSY